MIGFLVWDRVRIKFTIKVRVRVRVTFNPCICHWSKYHSFHLEELLVSDIEI